MRDTRAGRIRVSSFRAETSFSNPADALPGRSGYGTTFAADNPGCSDAFGHRSQPQIHPSVTKCPDRTGRSPGSAEKQSFPNGIVLPRRPQLVPQHKVIHALRNPMQRAPDTKLSAAQVWAIENVEATFQ